ncbi:MAG: PEP-CTERM sorting domain-containing protein [Planctomycetales bacterium]|nr:PEP-CTERM sorting domain-containing protein [Planctomycetales bacterium]
MTKISLRLLATTTASLFFTFSGLDQVAQAAPPVTTGLIASFDGANVTTSGSDVTSWNDQSGSGNHATQSLSGSYPTLVAAATTTGTNAILFDGTDDFLDIAPNPSDFDFTSMTWYVVRKADLNDNSRLLTGMYNDIDSLVFGDQYSGQAWASLAGSSNRHRALVRDVSNTFFAADASSTNTDAFFVTGGMWDGNSSTDNVTAILHESSSSRVVGTTSILDNPELSGHLRTRIGAGATYNDIGAIEAPNSPFSGMIAEILIYDRLLSPSEQTSVENYLLSKHIAAGPNTFTWNFDGSGGWADHTKWSDSYYAPPASNDQHAIFGDAIVGDSDIVFVDDDLTVNSVSFTNTLGGSYAIGGLGKVVFDQSSSFASPTIAVSGGSSHQFQTPVQALDNLAITAAGGSLDFNNQLDLSGNTLTISGDVNINHSAVGNGQISVTSGSLGTAGSTSITGSLLSAGTLKIDLGANNTDFFNFSGAASLAGTVDVELEAGYVPSGTYTILTAAGGLSAGSVMLDPSDTSTFELLVQGNSLVLSVLDVENANFDGIGGVDGFDFLAWQRGFGKTTGAVLSDGNADGDSDVDGNDLAIWEDQFGTSGGGGMAAATIPEPSSLLLVAFGAMATVLAGRKRQANLSKVLVLLLCVGLGTMATEVFAAPPITTGLITQLDADTGITLDSGEVSGWADQSGNGNNASNSVIGERPVVISSATPAGTSVLSFDGGDLLDIGPSSDFESQQLTWFVVFQADALDNGRYINGMYEDVDLDAGDTWSGQAWQSFVASSGRHRVNVRDDAQGFHAATSPNNTIDAINYFIGIGSWDGTNGTTDNITNVVVDGLGTVTTSTAVAYDTDPNATLQKHFATRIGGATVYNVAQTAPAPLQNGFDGQIAEVLVYNSLLNSIDTTQVVSYLLSKHFTGVPVPTEFTWDSPDSASWTSATRWTDSAFGPPQTKNQKAILGDAIGSENRTVTILKPVTVNAIEFNNTLGGSYAVAGLDRITLEQSDSLVDPAIEVLSGDHEIQVALTLADDLSVTVTSGSLALNNEINLGGNTLTLSGAVSVNHAIVGGGTVVNLGSIAAATMGADFVNEGIMTIELDALGADSFDIAGNATLSGTLDVRTAAGVEPAGSYTVLTSGGTLDAANLALDPSDAGLYRLSVSGNSLMLTAIPEPASLALACLSTMLLLGRRKAAKGIRE